MNRGLYDIHMHLIPGVDDGSLDMSMTRLLMCHTYQQGTRVVFATPHSIAFLLDSNSVIKKFEEIKRVASNEFPELQLYLGCEVMCEAESMKKTISALESGQFPTMNHTNYVLSEFQPWVSPQDAISCVSVLEKRGFLPILAHVERYPKLIREPETLGALRQMGCLFQINIYSVCEEDNIQIREAALNLLEGRMVDFLGSDAHTIFHRPPKVEKGLQHLYECYETSYINQIAWGNAEHLLIRSL